MIARLRSLRRDRRGAAAMEFAMVAPPFLLLIMGVLDLGHIMWTKSMLQGAVEKAGRDSTLEGGAAAISAIDQRVREQVRVAVPTAAVTFSRRSSAEFSYFGRAEPLTVDPNGNDVLDPRDCYTDVNNNRRRDTLDPSEEGQGGAGAAVIYKVDVDYPHWFPMPGLISLITRQPQSSGNVRLSASTVLRNQPYDNGRIPAEVCV